MDLPDVLPASWDVLIPVLNTALIITILTIAIFVFRSRRYENHTLPEKDGISNPLKKSDSLVPSPTYRLQGIPLGLDRDAVAALVSTTLQLECDVSVDVRSLASSPYPMDMGQIATLSFSSVPIALLDEKKNRWVFTVREQEGGKRKEITLVLDTHFLGFTPFQHTSDCAVDLIAISGLGGHAFGSFKERKGSHMWLRDCLPDDLPMARILIYGYDSRMLESKSVQTIRDLANSFRNEIKLIRTYSSDSDESNPEKPLILIGHSLGGLIIKEALIRMHDGYPDDRANLKATYMLLFFGVPNHGIDTDSFVSMVEDGPNRYLVETLKGVSEVLQSQNEKFPQIFNFFDSKVISFYETKETSVATKIGDKWERGGKPVLLVSRNSATHARSWETGENFIHPIDKDHSDMVKFGKLDGEYRVVLHRLQTQFGDADNVIRSRFLVMDGIVTGALLAERAKNHREVIIDMFRDHSGTPSSKSVKWFLKSPQYQRWRNEVSHPVLCFMDEEYSGLYMLQQIWRQKYHGPTPRMLQQTTVFVKVSPNAQKSGLETLAVMFESILYQIISFGTGGVELFDEFLKRDKVLQDVTFSLPFGQEARPTDIDRLRRFIVTNLSTAMNKLLIAYRNASLGEAIMQSIPDEHIRKLGKRVLLGSNIDTVLINSTLRLLLEAIQYILRNWEGMKIDLVFDGIHNLSEDNYQYFIDLFSANDEQNQRVRYLLCARHNSALQELVGRFLTIDNESETERCLNTLFFHEWEKRMNQIQIPSTKKSDWIWTNRYFQHWEEKGGILWIKGKPGSGKSTTARTIIHGLMDQENRSTKSIIASFFYSSKIGKKATSHEYMIRSLLYQILKQDSSLYSHYRETYRRLCESDADRVAWDKPDLQLVFENIAQDNTLDRGNFYCILDGLDESDPSDPIFLGELVQRDATVQLLSWLSKMISRGNSNPWLRLIVISRETQSITRRNIGCDWEISVEDCNTEVIKEIVRTRIDEIKGLLETNLDNPEDHEEPLQEDLLQVIEDKLLQLSGGVIMWVVLVLETLRYEADEACMTEHSLLQTVEALPSDLIDLYKDIIKRLQSHKDKKHWSPEDWELRARRMLMWTFAVKRPLSLAEFRDAIALDWNHTADSSNQSRYKGRRLRLEGRGWDYVSRAITNTCGGLLEVVPQQSSDSRYQLKKRRDVGRDHLVQFCHETVKNFLTRGEVAKPLSLDKDQACRDIYAGLKLYITTFPPMPQLREKPIAQWEASDFRELASHLEDRPLLSYYMEFFQIHEDESNAVTTLTRNPSRLAFLPLLAADADRYAFFKTLFNAALDAKFYHTISLLVLGYFQLKDEDIRDACLKSIDNGNVSAADVLLRAYRDSTLGLSNYMSDINQALRTAVTVDNSSRMIELLLEHNADIENEDRRMRMQTVLHYAVTMGNHDAVATLLNSGAIIHHRDADGLTALHLSANTGRETITKLLLKYNADVNLRDDTGQTPLSLAARSGHHEVIELLLTRDDIQVNSKDNEGQTPLSCAAMKGHKEIVRMLLNHGGVNVNSRDSFAPKQTLLSVRNKNGLPQSSFFYRSSDPDLLDSTATSWGPVEPLNERYGQTPLSWAAREGKEKVVELLLGLEDTDINSRDVANRTPLLWAAREGHENVLRLLLSRRHLDLNSRDSHGQTALSWAARNGQYATARLLLGHEAIDVSVRDNSGQTALLWAAREGHTRLVELLLHHGDIELEAKDKYWGQTPLSWAARRGHKDIVEVLLCQNGIDINSRDKHWGQTPLSWATKEGHGDIAQLLRGCSDVDVHAKDRFRK